MPVIEIRLVIATQHEKLIARDEILIIATNPAGKMAARSGTTVKLHVPNDDCHSTSPSWCRNKCRQKRVTRF
jgi:hypothetical protein